MREILEALAAGETSVEAAEAELRGYASNDGGRFDAARESRGGVPEAILGDGKTPAEVAALASTAVETTGRAIVTRVTSEQAGAVRRRLAEDHPDATMRWRERSNVVVARGPDFEPPRLDADVGIVTAGTSDAVPAGEAAAIVGEMGARVGRIDDVGVAGIARLLDRLEDIRAHDVVIVAAGREGALPTVVAGLVDVPVIGLPVSTGYGQGGDGEAAALGMLQSCTALTTVNVDAGFTAGAQAGLIARQLDDARGKRA
ncbi:Pyridinium-3,5-biscarboxylic acid mononucleotidesynthase [Halorhabdus sp. SVX81]|uniref:nickel pincer cofactor biosynthesis protein LarB n=1 Tax=Halorhabdus sp. SVX81 TaxID=2978283 RepID=UPI0023DC862E|nr:nickel pincer cofactor biosynthesis protein LarB [Halorhabdus sp. SVX81]WEL18473.1 Pyridinium-3,5-biscarboxylic acid mononucleotidesynthase [Halorhabdus sp. SVX81]